MVTEVKERMESVAAPRTMFGSVVGWIGAVAFAVSGRGSARSRCT